MSIIWNIFICKNKDIYTNRMQLIIIIIIIPYIIYTLHTQSKWRVEQRLLALSTVTTMNVYTSWQLVHDCSFESLFESWFTSMWWICIDERVFVCTEHRVVRQRWPKVLVLDWFVWFYCYFAVLCAIVAQYCRMHWWKIWIVEMCKITDPHFSRTKVRGGLKHPWFVATIRRWQSYDFIYKEHL